MINSYKLENVFIELGFKREYVGKNEYLRYGNTYCRVTFIKTFSAFVMESAESRQDAENAVLEDGDLYYIETSEEELLKQFREDVVRDYMK